MVAEIEVVCQQNISIIPAAAAMLDVQFLSKSNNHRLPDIQEVVSISSSPNLDTKDLSSSQVDIKSEDKISDFKQESSVVKFSPTIRSGSFADIGPRRYMEDEHIRIDDLSLQFGSLFSFPQPGAFYGVFDGHGGPEAAAYVRKNVIRLFFEDVNFPQNCEVDDIFLKEIEVSLKKSFLLADIALAEDSSVNSSSGTTALTALIFGSILMVANAGDCRAVLCRKGVAIDMSQDHRPSHPSERRRVQELGGFIDDGYLNGVLSVTRALGDWDMKFPKGSRKPLIAEPEFRQMNLTEDDEFLIIGCDGIWDVMSSQQAVSLVRRGLRRHDDPEQSAKDLVMEALRLNTFDNLTVVVVCLAPLDNGEPLGPRQRRLRCCSLSADALCSLRSLLEG